MSTETLAARTPYVHPDDPAKDLAPGKPFLVDGLDWSWAFVVYKDIDEFPGYKVGSDGTAWTGATRSKTWAGCGSDSSFRIDWRKLRPNNSHYQHVNLCREGKVFRRLVHRLVLQAFIGPCPDGMECCHWDDEGWNNRLSNLRWDTFVANHSDMKRNGNERRAKGENHPRAKLDDGRVREIRSRHAAGEITKEALGEEYGISSFHVNRIIKRKYWAHVI